jgi:ribosome biogenesis GTPase
VISSDGERIEVVQPRSSALTRRASSDTVRAESHTIAANLDVVLVVQAASQPINLRRIERELVLAFDSGAVPMVVLNKCDEVNDVLLASRIEQVHAVAMGVGVVAVSARSGAGLEDLKRHIYMCAESTEPTIALIGASGVGKSTLVNALLGEDRQRTGTVRDGDQRGRHTTTAAELLKMESGGWIVDTPGLRAVSLWTSHRGIERAFADVFSAASACKFRDCKHESEPNCGVRDGIVAGTFSEERVANMKTLVAEEQALEAEQEARVKLANRKGSRRAP